MDLDRGGEREEVFMRWMRVEREHFVTAEG